MIKEEEDAEHESADKRAGQSNSPPIRTGQLTAQPTGRRTAHDCHGRDEADQDQDKDEGADSIGAGPAGRGQECGTGDAVQNEPRQARNEAGSQARPNRLPTARATITRGEPSRERKAKLEGEDCRQRPVKECATRLLGSDKEDRQRRTEASSAKDQRRVSGRRHSEDNGTGPKHPSTGLRTSGVVVADSTQVRDDKQRP